MKQIWQKTTTTKKQNAVSGHQRMGDPQPMGCLPAASLLHKSHCVDKSNNRWSRNGLHIAGFELCRSPTLPGCLADDGPASDATINAIASPQRIGWWQKRRCGVRQTPPGSSRVPLPFHPG